ncbi:MFS transporter [Alicyclobacillus suci]|uniref:MFS transporter n=1 Tax=Alicyclobacillus suci TaxID=2816080 RepID=UPI003F6A0A42
MFKKYSALVITMLFLANVINYLDRSAFSIAAPMISKGFTLTPSELGMIFSSFFVGYAIFNFVGGFMSDLYGPKKVFGGSMTLWSIFCGLTAVTFNFASLFIVRLLFGFTEGPLVSTTNKTINNWVPQKTRARAVGIAFAGSPLGGAVAGPIVGLIAVHSNWQVSFVVITLIGLIWALVWMKAVTDKPSQNRKIPAAELAEIERDTTVMSVEGKAKVPLKYYAKKPTILFTALAFFAYNYILYFFLTWFPSYLADAKHLSISKMSVATTIPWVVGTVGLLLSGWASDYLFKLTNKLMFSRKVIIVGGLIGAAVCIAATGMVTTAVSAVVLMTIGIFFMYLTGAIYWAVISDNVQSDKVGGASGFVHMLANISGIIAPTITGFIVQFTGSFSSAFLLAGILAVVGAICVAFWVKPLTLPKQTSEDAQLGVTQ